METLFGKDYNNLYELEQDLLAAKPPPVDFLVPHLPSGKFHEPPSQSHPYDFVKNSKMGPRTVPWTVPYASPGVFAVSKNGVAPTRVFDYHLYGPRTYLYSEVQNFTNGKSDPINKEFGDDLNSIVGWEKSYPNIPGPRGVSRADPYCSVISHPHLDLSGNYNAHLPNALFIWHNRQVGAGWSDGNVVIWGSIPGTKPIYQTCVDKSNRGVMYAAELTGPIIKVVRGAGEAASGKTEDPSLYTVTTAFPATWPTSVDTHTDGTVFYVDEGKVYKNGVAITPLTTAFALVVDSPRNRFLVVTNSMSVYSFDFTGAQQWVNVIQNISAAKGADFFTIDIDENGTNGPGGVVRTTRVHTNGNCNAWQLDPDGTNLKFSAAMYPGAGQGWNVCGDIKNGHEIFGHYVWVNHFHRYQAIYYKGGYGDTILSFLVCDPPLPPTGTLPYQLVWSGMSVIARYGLTSVVSVQGASKYLGCSYDEMAELTFDQILAFLQAGMITETPRPEIQGIEGVWAVGAIIANSQRAMREGKPFFDSYMAWAQTKGLGTNYGTVLYGGHFVGEPTPVVFFETDGTAIAATDAGRSTPIRYTWPPVNTVVASTAGQQIINDRGVAYCSPGPTKARVL